MEHSKGMRWSQPAPQRPEQGQLSATERFIRLALLLAFGGALVLEGWLLWQVWRLF